MSSKAIRLDDIQQLALVRIASDIAGKSVLDSPSDDVFCCSAHEAARDLKLIKATTSEKQSVDVVSRIMRGMTISSENKDRVGDIIRQNGWHFESFNANPVVLWAHMHRELPVGKSSPPKTKGKFTSADQQFAEHEFAEDVMNLYAGGFLNASSVGFRALEWKLMFDEKERFTGVEFIRQELLEWSDVPVPANADATLTLSNAKSFGSIREASKFYETLDAYIRDSVIVPASLKSDNAIDATQRSDGLTDDELQQMRDLAEEIELSNLVSAVNALHRRII